MMLENCDDYREFLRERLVNVKPPQRRASLAMLSKRWGVSRMFVKYVLDGKRHLSL